MPPENSTSALEITESLLVDTTTTPSLLAVTIQATGSSANTLRQQLENMGREQFEQERLQYFTKRYVSAKRLDKVLYRDRRDADEFSLTEVFEVNGFLKTPSQGGMCTFQLPGNAIIDVLQPSADTTHPGGPLVLPHPCNIIHRFEVLYSATQATAAPRLGLESACLRFSRRQKNLHRNWSMTLELATLAGVVPPERLGEHTRLIAQIVENSACCLFLPPGVPRPRRPYEFGRLPPELPNNTPATPGIQNRPAANPAIPAHHSQENASIGRVERRRVRSMRTKDIVLLVILSLSILIIGYLLFFLLGVPQPGG